MMAHLTRNTLLSVGTKIQLRFSAFEGTIHIYALKRGHAIAGIGFTIAKSLRHRKGEDEDEKKNK